MGVYILAPSTYGQKGDFEQQTTSNALLKWALVFNTILNLTILSKVLSL